MSQIDDTRALISSVIRATRNISRRRDTGAGEAEPAAVEAEVASARDVLGAYGEGKGLTAVVALCTEHLDWRDLAEVGVPPTSKPAWRVLLNDLVNIGVWDDDPRRERALKILHKLAYRVEHAADELPQDTVTIIDFCDERGVVTATLRYRLSRHNARLGTAQIHPVGLTGNRRALYKRGDLMRLLTEQERSRCS